MLPVSVEFPAGSAVRHAKCANISITADGLVEADESFSIRASFASHNSVRFVGEYQPSAVVEVIIRDDDGKSHTFSLPEHVLCIYQYVHFVDQSHLSFIQEWGPIGWIMQLP